MDFRRAHRSVVDFRRRALAALAGFAFVWAGSALAEVPCGGSATPAVGASVDERLDVLLQDGRIVRLGGLDLPDASRGAPETFQGARGFLIQAVVGRPLLIAPLSKEPDRWGRAVADILRPGASGSPSSVAAELLTAGFARVKPESEARGCAAKRLAAEQEARQAGKGVWRDPAYGVIAASDVVTIRSRNGRFVIVEGRVLRVGFGRSRLYLDLVSRDGPTIVVARKLAAAFARADRRLETLAGQIIRARGALDARFEPRIEVSEPAMIEIVRQSSDLGSAKAAP